MNTQRKTSLFSRFRTLIMVCVVPLFVGTIYFLLLINSVASRYEAIVDNITKVNEYNLTFKEDIDYIMYIITVNSDRASLLVDTEKPHILINSAKETFTELLNSTKEKEQEDRARLIGIIKYLDTLDEHVRGIEETSNIVGMYDENISCLELDIRVLTELIQDNIQHYISDEVQRLDRLRGQLHEEVTQILITSFIALAFILLIAVVYSGRIINHVRSGLEALLSVSRKAGHGDFDSRVDTQAMDVELAELGNGYNHMVEKLDALVEDIKAEQLNQRITEQKLLQAQINPHFLYNTLDNIMWLAEAGENENVIMMVSALSDFFRTTLSKGRDDITIEEEESHIRSYLQIQQFRYQDILEYDINIDPGLSHYTILKLTLQPLVENALYHGIKNKRGMGHIRVTGYKEGNVIRLAVADDGIGMTPEKVEEVKRSLYRNPDKHPDQAASFGLYNVHQRLRLNYGEEYGIDIASKFGAGTTVTVKIPTIT